MDLVLRKKLVTERFVELYGRRPTARVRAPGRVDLMGSHTDYNLGYVLTLAIDRDTWIFARPRDDGQVRVASLNAAGNSTFSLDAIDHDAAAPWADYVRGVAWALKEAGYPLSGFDGLVHSTIPFGSGLSSSAALEVATAVLLRELGGWEIDPVRLALLCQRAENAFVGMNCGILDQYSSMLGRADSVLLLDCRDLSSETRPKVGRIQVVICDTRAERALTGSEYPERRAQCEEGARILAGFYPQVRALRDVSLAQLEAHRPDLSEVVYRRCRFVVQENQRVLDMAEALAQGDESWICRLAAESYEGARDLYEIVSREMELMMAAMLDGPGAIGARQAGAGFGGCMVALVRQPQVEAFADHVRERYEAAAGIEPQVYAVEAAAGAGLLDGPTEEA